MGINFLHLSQNTFLFSILTNLIYKNNVLLNSTFLRKTNKKTHLKKINTGLPLLIKFSKMLYDYTILKTVN